MRETITDYETQKVTREVIWCDLDGKRLSEEETVTLAANPRIWCGHIVSDGTIEVSSEGFARLSGIEAEEITPGDQVPSVLVNCESAQVVEHSLIDGPLFRVSIGKDGNLNEIALLASVCTLLALSYFLIVSPPKPSLMVGVLLTVCFVVSVGWSAVLTGMMLEHTLGGS